MKLKILLILFAVFSCSLIVIHSLSLASQKEFWLDEVFEIQGVMAETQKTLWISHTGGSPSATPLYFSLQKVVMPHILQSEKSNGHGYDWKISFRLVPAITLALGVFVAFFLALRIHPLFALSLPLFLCCYNFALYYAAETRIYATWLGLALAFYMASLNLCSKWSKRDIWIWYGLILLMGLTCISSFMIVLFVVPVLLYFNWGNKKFYTYLAGGFLISVLVMMKYRVTSGSINLARFFENFSLVHVKEEGVRMLEGPQKAVLFLVYILLLIAIGIFGTRVRKLKFQKFYLNVALLSLGQVFALVGLYVLQYATGYWFAPRHGIFIVGIQGIVAATFVLFFYDLILSFKLAKKFEYALIGLLVVASFSNWFNWRVKDLPMALANIKTAQKSYCHGPVKVSQQALNDRDSNTKKFIELSNKRHSGQCYAESLKAADIYDFVPEWAYGRAN